MKKYTIYFVVAYFWGMLLQVIIDLLCGTTLVDIFAGSNIPELCLAGFVFAILMTLFKCLEERKRLKK